jgi:hypothetical protein
MVKDQSSFELQERFQMIYPWDESFIFRADRLASHTPDDAMMPRGINPDGEIRRSLVDISKASFSV